MSPTDPKSIDSNELGSELPNRDPYTAGDEMLERAKQVARTIDERIRKLTDDSGPFAEDTKTSLPLDSTDEAPPIE